MVGLVMMNFPISFTGDIFAIGSFHHEKLINNLKTNYITKTKSILLTPKIMVFDELTGLPNLILLP